MSSLCCQYMGMQVAYNPKVLLPFSHLGETNEMRVQDASCLAARDERLSFWELQVLAPFRLVETAQPVLVAMLAARQCM